MQPIKNFLLKKDVLIALILAVICFIGGFYSGKNVKTRYCSIDFHGNGISGVSCANISPLHATRIDVFDNELIMLFPADNENDSIKVKLPLSQETNNDWKEFSEKNWGKGSNFRISPKENKATRASWCWDGICFSASFDEKDKIYNLVIWP